MKKLTIAPSLTFIILVLVACGHTGTTLEQNQWSLKSYGEQKNPELVIEGTKITGTFDKDKEEVRGYGGCNTYSASYEINGDNLSISNLAWMERACLSPAGVMDQEQEFLSLFADAESFQVEDTSLTITCSDGSQLYFIIASDK